MSDWVHSVALLASTLLFSPVLLSQQSLPNGADALAGLWGTEQIIAAMVGGELTLDGRVSPWRASLEGFTVPVEHTGNTVIFTLPYNQGEFRGQFTANPKRIQGHWIQPASINPYQQ